MALLRRRREGESDSWCLRQDDKTTTTTTSVEIRIKAPGSHGCWFWFYFRMTKRSQSVVGSHTDSHPLSSIAVELFTNKRASQSGSTPVIRSALSSIPIFLFLIFCFFSFYFMELFLCQRNSFISNWMTDWLRERTPATDPVRLLFAAPRPVRSVSHKTIKTNRRRANGIPFNSLVNFRCPSLNFWTSWR